MGVKWKSVCVYQKQNAQKCYDEIYENGAIKETTPEAVVEKAKNKNTELHKCFEWNDKVAGHKYRIIQARDILCSFRILSDEIVESENKPFEVRAVVKGDEPNHYKPTKLVVQKMDEYQALLDQAKRELESFRRRYENLIELEKLMADIDELLN